MGFGNVGYHFADFVSKAGFKVVAVSDSKGGIIKRDSKKTFIPLDIPLIYECKMEKGSLNGCYCAGGVCDTRGGQLITNEELLMLPVDILIPAALEDVINEFVFKTPLEILAAFLVKHQLKEIAEDLFDSYDYFLSVLNNESKRKHLEGLSPKDINEDKTYQNLRKRGHIYQNSLTKMFFEGETSLRDFTIKYGVF